MTIKKHTNYRDGYKTNITLDEYIEMMEGQRIAHETSPIKLGWRFDRNRQMENS